MSEVILFIFEGVKKEKEIFTALQKHFLNDNIYLCVTFNTDIYQLYQKIKHDDFIDIVEVLRAKNTAELEGIQRIKIAEIYLFFDYDGHATYPDKTPRANDGHLKEMLVFFDNETENGRLYISYPMVEAVIHLKTGVNFKNIKVEAKVNIHYKNLASQQCDSIFSQIKKWEINHWAVIISEHCSKLNFLITDDYVFPHRTFEQLEVFEAQLTKYIISENKVAVLSAFPVLLLDYYGAKGLHNKISSHLTTQQESM